MVKKKLITSAIISSILLLVILIDVSGCGVGGSCGIDMGIDETKDLEPVEIREYEGENLSSVDDFRENSIKGPQQVDIESYQLMITGLVENPKSYTYEP